MQGNNISTILCGLPELYLVTGLNDFAREVFEGKVEEKVLKKVIFFEIDVNYLPN